MVISTRSPREGDRWGKPYDFPRVLPRDHFQAILQERGTQVEPGVHLELKRWSWETKNVEVFRVGKAEYWRVETCAQRVLQRFVRMCEPSYELWSEHVCEETPKPPKGTEGRILRPYTGLQIVFPPVEWKTLSFLEHQAEYSKGLALIVWKKLALS